MHGEHAAVFDLVKHADATHIAVSSGSWSDPATWADGVVPGDDAKVVIGDGVHVTYDAVSDARLFTVRVDGHLDFATDRDTKMVVDTMVVDMVGRLTIGTEEDPMQPGVSADIVIANNGAIDVGWDPMLLSRGIVSHGAVEMHGQEKTVHLKVAEDPMAGDTSIALSEVPEGWQVGDTIVLAGTRYQLSRYDKNLSEYVRVPPEDEVLTITAIEGNEVFFDTPLQHDHDTPRADLKTSVANYSRSITIATEEPETAAVHERGHVMFMHSDDVDVRYAAFHELGRTDKSVPATTATEAMEDPASDANVTGRYSFHFHRTGLEDQENPAIAIGNAVYGSPGWGYVHHDSHAVLHNNAAFDTFGAGFVSETGNETGTWTNNIAIQAEGTSLIDPKQGTPVGSFEDFGQTGDGFWFQSRMIESSGNIAASVNTGFVFFHRGEVGEGGQLPFDASVFELPDLLKYNPSEVSDTPPILHFDNNETFAARGGVQVSKASPNQGHDVRSHFTDFTAWNVRNGIDLLYTGHYTVEGLDLIADTESGSHYMPGVQFGTAALDLAIIDARIEGFTHGFRAQDRSTPEDPRHYTIINPEFIDVDTAFDNFNPALDIIALSHDQIVPGRFEIELDAPLHFFAGSAPGAGTVEIRGTKTDSLGTVELPAGNAENYNLTFHQVLRILETDGYYETADGQRYFVFEAYYGDRVTSETFKVGHLVEIDDNVPLGNIYTPFGNARLNGILDLDSVAPETQSEVAETAVETELVIDLLANDSDADGDTLAIDGILQPLHGEVFDNGDGTVTYRPDFGFSGVDTFKYWVTDGHGNFTPATVTVQVSPGEAPAVIDAGGDAFDAGSLDLPTDQGLHITATAAGHWTITTPDGAEHRTVINTTELTGTDTDDIFEGLATNDLFHGAGGNDILNGGAGSDELYGGNGNDTLIAGTAGTPAQVLSGDAGDDTYVLSRDSGTVIIGTQAETAGAGTADTVRFTDLNLSDLTVSVQQDGSAANTWLILAWNTNGTQGELRIAHEGTHIENFTFQDGTTTGLDALLPQEDAILGTDGADTLRGTGEGETFRTGDGDDNIRAGAGDDILDPGAGSGGVQNLFGQAGNDTYLIGRDVGSARISHYAESGTSGTADRLVFTDLTRDQICSAFYETGGIGEIQLVLHWEIDGVIGEVRIAHLGQFIESYEFADDTILTHADFEEQLLVISGTDGRDSLRGTNLAERIETGDASDNIRAGAGDDILDPGAGGAAVQNLFGQGGNDTYLIGADSGTSRISWYGENENMGTADTVVFTDLNAADLTVSEYDTGKLDGIQMILSWDVDGVSGELRLAEMGSHIENFEFADGTTLSAQDLLI
ncbi:MAG: cadherin-like domain-containing protein [Pseudomonadota bacterium]